MCSYGVAWLLAHGGEGAPVSFEVGSHDGPRSDLAWPDAAELLRWWLSGESALEIRGTRLRFRWTRGG